MFMVASSVVSTILILNYHHRNADTHEMSEWVMDKNLIEILRSDVHKFQLISSSVDSCGILILVALYPSHESSGSGWL